MAATGPRQHDAPIVPLEEFERRRLPARVVATSGGFDPVHPGHIRSFQAAATLGDALVVIVVGDGYLAAKKGAAFQDLETRCLVLSALRAVDVVVPFEPPVDTTVTEALAHIRPEVFAKGGDRKDRESIPEWAACDALGIEVVVGVGGPKEWSSSEMLRAWSHLHPRD